ncbi:MAG: SUMF1/EgtB/PvdO family nonheme iron enzyme, partial [Chloroflexota bacterium]
AFEQFPFAVQALIANDIDTVIIDAYAGFGYTGENKEKVELVGPSISSDELGFIFPKSSDLVAPVNAALETMKSDGTLEKINLKYFGPNFVAPSLSLQVDGQAEGGTAAKTRISQKDGMEMIYIPAGEFLMGSADSDSDAYSAEKPQHKVYLDGYWMDKTEVTNAMFAKYVEATGYKTDSEKTGSGTTCNHDGCGITNGADWQHPGGPGSNIDSKANHPVVQMNWNDAKGYCEWGGGRLPTEAEWEKGARGEDGRKYPWGNGSPDKSMLNFDMNLVDTAAVGSYPSGASPYGLLDMSGNVAEWVNDWYGDNYYQSSPQKNPTGPDSGTVGVLGTFRVLRGGSWNDDFRLVRAAFRVDPNFRGVINGFRCVRLP